ncbi:MAG: hypothetical protein LBE34_04865 [Flavobacteriaceae bacterium]|jgi:hypothetical protein|nr:hypothetical protein [Flavobacteriaceae bacterium]
MNYNLEIQKVLLKIEELKNFEDKVVALKEAIQIADQHNDIDWGFDLRLNLIRQERNTSRCVESFPAFAWILNISDTNEGYFDEAEFLWEYKWMYCSAYRNASIPMEQIESIGEDLKRRLVSNGFSKRAYYNVRTGLAMHLRDYKLAQELVDLADAELLDDMANCPACELDTKVEILLYQGLIDESLVKAQDLINKKLTCYSMPFQTFCCFAYYLLQAGDDRASMYFDKALEEYHAHDQYDSSVGYSMGLLVAYMHQTNHPDLWTFFEKIADWEVNGEDLHRYNFARYMGPIMKQGGTKELQLSSQLPYYKADGVYDLNELYHYFKTMAYDLAAQFDQRNGNDNYKTEIESVLS